MEEKDWTVILIWMVARRETATTSLGSQGLFSRSRRIPASWRRTFQMESCFQTLRLRRRGVQNAWVLASRRRTTTTSTAKARISLGRACQ